MPLSREAIYAALFARLQAKVTLCKTFSRKWMQPEQLGVEQQPALLCMEAPETPRDDPTLPPQWTMEAEVVAYARTNDSPTPGAILSNLLDQIEGALERQNTEGGMPSHYQTTLGVPGVQRVWIAGQVDKEDGAMSGGQGILLVTIHILAVP